MADKRRGEGEGEDAMTRNIDSNEFVPIPAEFLGVAFYECLRRNGELVAVQLLFKDNTVTTLEGEALTDEVRQFVGDEEDDSSALPLYQKHPR